MKRVLKKKGEAGPSFHDKAFLLGGARQAQEGKKQGRRKSRLFSGGCAVGGVAEE